MSVSPTKLPLRLQLEQSKTFFQHLDDARTFMRYAEAALTEASAASMDKETSQDIMALKAETVQMRCHATNTKQVANKKFNPGRLASSHQKAKRERK